MTKLLVILALAVLACRTVFGRWPWELARRTMRSGPEAQARALLGVREGASREEIIDAHRRHVAQVHPDRGGTSELVHEVNAARDLLLGARVRRNGE
ncbi:MAG TPA: molecular chaperone DnaJ [Novosphingobium sp.]